MTTGTNILDLPWTPVYVQSAKTPTQESYFSYYALAATVFFTATVYALEGVLDARQKKAYTETTFPAQLETTVSLIDNERNSNKSDKDTNNEKPQDALLPQLHEKFTKAQAYGLDKINFGMLAGAYDTLETIVFLLVGFFPYCWDVSCRCGQTRFGWTETDDEIKISLLYIALITLVGTLTSLPFELYSTFQIERKHGFNKQTVGLFVVDKIKSLVLTFVIGGPFVALLLTIIKRGGDYFYVRVWACLDHAALQQVRAVAGWTIENKDLCTC
jgi:STE24 endopeptidase